MKGGLIDLNSKMMKSILKDKKGLSLGDLYPAVLTIVLIGIILGIGLYILASVETNVGGTASTAINTTITGLATFADWIAIIVVVLAAAVVLGVVLSSFGGRSTGI